MPQYAVIFTLRVIQLFAIPLALHFFFRIIGNLATGKLLFQVVGFALAAAGLIASSLALAYLQRKYPATSKRALTSADQRFGTQLSPRAKTFFLVLLVGFILLVVSYMLVCLFWNPRWLP